VHAAARHGITIPESALKAHGLDVSVPIDEREVAGATRRAAIRNWVDSLLDELLEPISFDRSENLRHAVEAIIAAVAQGAYAHGLNSARPTASWYYETGEVPTAGQVSRLLRGIDSQEILRMFTDINRRFIRIASEYGFFDRDYNYYALDTSWVMYEGKHVGEDGELKLMENPKDGTAWLFAALCVMDVDARFALGLDLVEDKSETTEQFWFLLRTAAGKAASTECISTGSSTTVTPSGCVEPSLGGTGSSGRNGRVKRPSYWRKHPRANRTLERTSISPT